MTEKMIETQELDEKWESITLANDIMFFLVMQDEELLLELVRRILPELDIDHIVPQTQKQLEVGADAKGVRFDVFLRDDIGRAITVEMQIKNYRYLPKRMRYYASMGDIGILGKSESYANLPEAYVILICPFDYYGLGRHKYTFRRICLEQNDLEMDDGVTCIVLNASGTENDVDIKLRAFLDYLVGIKSEDEYIEKLDNAVSRGRMNWKWRRCFMTLEQRDLESRLIGREEGLEEGLKAGREEGVKLTIALCKKLDGSFDDAVESVVSETELSQEEAETLVKKYW